MHQQYLVRPQEQKFWKILAFLLTPFTLGHQHWWGFPKQSWIFDVMYYVTLIFGPTSFLSQVIYFYIHHNDYPFFQLGNIFTVITVAFMILMKVFCARKYNYEQIMKKFMSSIHLYYYEPRNEFTKKTLIKMERYSRWVSMVLVVSLSLDTLSWLFIPIVNNVLNGAYSPNSTAKLQTCLYMVMPFDYEHDLKNWIIIHGINLYVVSCGLSLFVVFDTILYSIIFHLIGRIEILTQNLKDISKFYNSFSENEIKERLVLCVRDHLLIIRCFGELQDAFGLSVTSVYASNLVCDSLLILELQYGDRAIIIAYCFTVVICLGSLFMMSLVMEAIRIQSDNLPNAVYDIPWETMPLSHQKIVLIMLARVQPKLIFKAFGGLEAGVRPTISIMKSTFSYYVMLKTRSERFLQK